MAKKTLVPVKGKWIYWRWVGDKTFLKRFVQDILETDSGMLLEISDNDMWSNFPTRVLRKEIFIVKVSDT